MKNALKKINRLKVDENLYTAAKDYLQLKRRETHPDGKFDNAKRFQVSCKYHCCVGIRSPSRAYPFSQLVHARTARHVAHEHGMADREKDIRSLSRILEKHPILADSYEKFMIVILRYTAQTVINQMR